MNILIIGVGNEFRCDDGVGLSVARRIAEQHIPGVIVMEESGEGTALMNVWKDAATVVVIDATSSGSVPGTVVRIDAHLGDIPSRFFNGSTHSFGLAEAVTLSRVLNTLPSRLIIFGIEGKYVGDGVMLSNAVEQSSNDVVNNIVEEINVLQHQCTRDKHHA